jgi:endonuclease-3 related protein
MASDRPAASVPAAPTLRPVSVREILDALEAAYGDQHWHWMPGMVASPLDIIAGSILVQHTIWRTAERALESLQTAGALDVDALLSMSEDEIAALVRVAGAPAVKARRLRAIATTIADAGGLDGFLRLPLSEMRPLLLAAHGVGPETADAIALYAAGLRTFVIDNYTTRMFRRLGAGPARDRYADWQRFFENALPEADAAAFQRYHASIVLHGKDVCRAKPRCESCILRDTCHRIGVTPPMMTMAGSPARGR